MAHCHESEKVFEVFLAQQETCSNNDLLWFAGQMFLGESLFTLVMRRVHAEDTKRRPTDKNKAKDIGRNGRQFVLENRSTKLKTKV